MTPIITLQAMAANLARTMSDSSSTDVTLESKFMQIVETHGSLIARLCFYYSKSTSDFDDLRQDCLINIWRGLKSFNERSSLTTWLYRVCLNTCITSMRKGRSHPEEVSLELAREVAGDDDTERRENLQELYQLISGLPLFDRGLIMMWLDGRTYDEIADVSGISQNNVAVRLHRIKQKLYDEANNN